MVEEGEGDAGDDNEVDADVHALLDQVPALVGPRSIVDLPGGLTNRNLRVTTSTGDYVVRLTQSDAGLLGIDRDAEHANTRAAAEAGVGAQVVGYRPDLGLMVITYLPGVALTNETIGKPGVLTRCADAVRRLQAGPRFVNDFDMFARQAGYLSLVRQHGFALPTGYEDFTPAWERVRRALAAVPVRTVPCNNDLLAGNYIDDGDRVWLIDYEYSGNNDPAFELGNTATECDLTTEQIDELVAAWSGGDPDPAYRSFRARVDLQALCSEYGWSLWGFIQAATSPIDFDFHGWGMERYEKAARRFTSDGFDDLVDTVGMGRG
jgi:thiamine kinase-like enzyme